MAGSVLSTFTNGYAGAVSRAVDNVISAFPNTGDDPIAYGAPVMLSASGGVVLFSSTATADDLLGFAVRSGSKTPDEYGSSLGRYNAGDIVEVLTRGSITVPVAGTPAIGDTVNLVKATGAVTATAAEGTTVALPHVHFRSARDGKGMAEIAVLSRNVL